MLTHIFCRALDATPALATSGIVVDQALGASHGRSSCNAMFSNAPDVRMRDNRVGRQDPFAAQDLPHTEGRALNNPFTLLGL